MMTEMEINPEVLSRWRQEVSDLSTGVERINDSVYVFYSTEADLLAVRVLGDRTIHLYDITNTLLPDTMTAKPWPLWASQWRDVGRLLDAGDVEGAKHLAEKLVILELSEGTVEEEEE